MTTRLISFATTEYRAAQERLSKSAAKWFDQVRSYGPADLAPEFMQANREMFSHRRGFGYWIWKPWLILRELESMGPTDVLFYADSQCVFEADPAPLFKLALRYGGIGLFHQRREKHKNSTWTRGDCFALMGCDGPKYRNGDNLATTYSVWSGTRSARAFAREWLKWCCNYQVVSDAPSVAANSPNFKDHRHDQSVASLLAIKHEIPTLCDPSQFGKGYREGDCDYPVILNVARSVKAPWLRRPNMSSIIEVSTLATCPLRCSYCPQDKLGAAYKGPEMLTLEMFARCLDNTVPGDAIHFSGFTEPSVNPQIVEFIEMAINRGHRVKVYTTGRGLNVAKAERVAKLDLDLLMLHLPDEAGHLSHSTNNVAVLEALSKHPNAQCMAMGNQAHADVGHIWEALPKNYGAMHDRAGNLGLIELPKLNHKGAIKCGAAPQLDHPVLLPNGNLALCCCDYSLAHIVGNLAESPLSEIMGGREIQRVMELQRGGGDVICRSCAYAVPA